MLYRRIADSPMLPLAEELAVCLWGTSWDIDHRMSEGERRELLVVRKFGSIAGNIISEGQIGAKREIGVVHAMRAIETGCRARMVRVADGGTADGHSSAARVSNGGVGRVGTERPPVSACICPELQRESRGLVSSTQSDIPQGEPRLQGSADWAHTSHARFALSTALRPPLRFPRPGGAGGAFGSK